MQLFESAGKNNLRIGWRKEIGIACDSDTLLNHPCLDNSDPIINLGRIVMMQYVYRSRCMNTSVTGYELMSLLNQCKSIEKYYAQKNNNISKYNKHWHVKIGIDISKQIRDAES